MKYSALHNTFRSLLANKTRSFLTVLGIIIGVSAVIIIMSIGAGAQEVILSQVKTLGTDIVSVLPGGRQDDNSPPASVMGIVITTLNLDDLKALKKSSNVPDLKAAYGLLRSNSSLSWESQVYDATVSGVSLDYLEVEGGEVLKGRFFSASEDSAGAKVVVLGSTVKKEIFGDSEAVGKRLRIKKHSFDIIGVMKERGTVGFQDYDDQVFVPVKALQTFIAGAKHLSLIRAKVVDSNYLDRAVIDIETTLREKHDIYDSTGKNDDFTVGSAQEALSALTSITDALTYFLIAMASLSLLVGGVGIMNIMLVSVKERTREIGLRKAIGASRSRIIRQFLSESLFLTLIGGLIGLVLGILFSWLVAQVIIYLNFDWHFIVTWQSMVLAVSVSTLIGLVFGLYPAIKASKLDPIEALRYE
ncbi:MAG: ABC transporter permease [Candidatus Pacebacteria bacterium]|nr:ABC transporter permease [Candidatus Paceibacterota bacterium]